MHERLGSTTPPPRHGLQGERDASQRGTTRNHRTIRPLCDRSWGALQQFLDGHLGGHVCLDALASAACVSRFHFARRFRARVGTSPMDYVMQRRIERAKERLARADATICEVAHDLGFFDQSHFCRTFCRRVGLTPMEYRNTRTRHPPIE